MHSGFFSDRLLASTDANEADYFEPDWSNSFWGSNYPRLLQIKKQVDPAGLFVCHHCVGSEEWTEDGMCRKSEFHAEHGDLRGQWRDPDTMGVL